MRIVEARQFPFKIKPNPEVCPPPYMDLKEAVLSRETAERLLVQEIGFIPPSLIFPTALALYNHPFALPRDPRKESTPSQQSQTKQVIQQLRQLAHTEIEARDATKPIVPIGIEVEADLRAFRDQANHMRLPYEDFFKTFGLGLNAASNVYEFWEFSPPASFSVEVVQRTISELIKGRFIPSLTDSKKPSDIEDLISDSLISLHINLGIPEKLSKQKDSVEAAGQDMTLLTSAFAIGYSSPKRLEKRKMKAVANKKEGMLILSNKEVILGERFEMKPLEVRDESVYTLLADAQLVGSSLLAHHVPDGEKTEAEGVLSTEWVETKALIEKIETFLQRKHVDILRLAKEKPSEMSPLLALLSPLLRSILHERSRRIKAFVSQQKREEFVMAAD